MSAGAGGGVADSEGEDAEVVEEAGWECKRTRRCESTTIAPERGCESIIHSREGRVSTVGGLLSGAMMAEEEEGKRWVFRKQRFTNGFIMLPVLQTHIPTPTSPSSAVVSV